MEKYKKQGDPMVAELKRKIEIIELADAIAAARFEKGIDRVPCDIHDIMDEVKKIKHLDDASIYCMLVSHRAEI